MFLMLTFSNNILIPQVWVNIKKIEHDKSFEIVGLVVEMICVWCLLIVAIFMGFGQAGEKRCEACLKVINSRWQWKSQKRGSFHREDKFSLCNTAVLWNLIANITGYILQKILYLLLLYYCCFTCFRLAKPKVQLNVF